MQVGPYRRKGTGEHVIRVAGQREHAYAFGKRGRLINRQVFSLLLLGAEGLFVGSKGND
jgi:hypothetical protein